MSQTKALQDHYKAVRDRLRNPPNAVPDPGINLKRKPEPTPEPPPPTVVIEFDNYTPICRKDITLSSTLAITAQEFNITPQEIRAHSRIRSICYPRQVAIYLAAKHTKQTFFGMGLYLDLDHTTILHANKKIKRLVEQDQTIAQQITAIEDKLLAAFNRTPVPAISEPHLGSEAQSQDRNERQDAVGEISIVDNSGRSTLCDAEKADWQPDVGGQVLLPSRTSGT